MISVPQSRTDIARTGGRCLLSVLAVLVLHLTHGGPLASGQVILNPNTIQGTLRFTNTDPGILSLLNAEGVTSVYVSASSQPPAPSITSTSGTLPPASPTNANYSVVVDSSESGIVYRVTPSVLLANGTQNFYFASSDSAPVVTGNPPVTLDFEECLGVVRLRFVNSAGDDLAVDAGQIRALGSRDQRQNVTPGSHETRFYLQGGESQLIEVTLRRGTNDYVDLVAYSVTTNVTVGCDEIITVDVVIPEAGESGRITGNADIVGEFEILVDGRDDLGYADWTGVIATEGPFDNQRWAALPGAVDQPSSGAYELRNVVPSVLDRNSEGYRVYAQMFFRTNRQIESFQSPNLGAGRNPRLTVAPGQSIDLGNLFVIQPGFVRGNVLLQGPTETLGRRSLLRGVSYASDYDLDADGRPDAIGTYGLYGTAIRAEGMDELVAGATYSAAGGVAIAEFPGEFDETDGSYRGPYELVVGGLSSEPTLWGIRSLNLALSSASAQGETNYYSTSVYVADRRSNGVEILPGQVVTSDVALCLSEVRIVFRSMEGTFHTPQIRFSNGAFAGTDFQGNPADYSVYVDPAYGTPNTEETAAKVGEVVLYLPQGNYHLLPYVVPSGNSGATTGLEPIDLSVECGQRISIEQCLRAELTLSRCVSGGPLTLRGTVRSCTNQVRQIRYHVDNGEPVSLCTDCGVNPEFSQDITVDPAATSITLTAIDDAGRESSIETPIGASVDTTPPAIQCPSDIEVTADRPCGAVVEFQLSATDTCGGMPSVVTSPASGSVFPVGETMVTSVARDDAGNPTECTFKVTVRPGGEYPAPTVDGVTPSLIALEGGTPITVRGANLTVDDEILLDGQPISFPVWISSNEIAGQAPALPAGMHRLQVRRCGEIVAELAGACRGDGLPRILRCDPPQAFARGGSLITIHGLHFTPTTRIRIGFPASGAENLLVDPVVSDDGTSIIGLVPRLPSGELLGPRDVVAEDTLGTDTLPAGLTYLPDPLETDPQVVSLRILETISTRELSVSFRNGFPNALNCRVKVGGTTAAERARRFVSDYRDLLLQLDPDVDLEVSRLVTDVLDNVVLAQKFRGVPIFAAEVLVSLVADEVFALTGYLIPSETLERRNLDVVPTLDAPAAAAAAMSRPELQLPAEAIVTASKLEIFDLSVLEDVPSDPHLVWRLEFLAEDREVMIDAHSGAIVLSRPLSQQHDGNDLAGFDLDMRDAASNTPAGVKNTNCVTTATLTTIATENTFNNTYNADNEAMLANQHIRDAYAFFHRNFDLHSYDNASARIDLFVHANVPNAQAGPGCWMLLFSNGWVDYEVMVHELTHMIIGSSSRLVYFGQSGALNESYADVMAVVADREAGDLNWTHAENRTSGAGANRDLEDPRRSTNPQPIFFSQFSLGVQQPDGSYPDSGGVHSNSGIANRAAFFMSEGLTIGGRAIQGMGLTKMRFVKYNALRNLSQNAGFVAARAFEVALVEALVALQITGFTSQDVCTTRNAWAGVAVGQADANCDGTEDWIADPDKDYIPSGLDNCPTTANPKQENSDTDGWGDACDNCDSVDNQGQEDMDFDNQGDVCDTDRDGDGCLNALDDNPDSSQQPIGTSSNPTCPNSRTSTVFGFTGVDSPLDADALRNCEDEDDDGDGIPDVNDPCPVGPLPGNISGECAVLGPECPRIPKDWWRTCFGGDCVAFFVRIVDRINPDPTRDVLVEHIRIVNQTLYLIPNAGVSLGDTARAIAKTAAPGLVRQAAEPQLRRIEIWQHATETEPAHLVAVVDEFDPTKLVNETTLGTVLAFTPERDNQPAQLQGAWHAGSEESRLTQDTDGDGLPDDWELLHGLNPGDAADAVSDTDGDGMTARSEFLAGTNPAAGTSRVALLSVASDDNALHFEVTAPAGRRLQIERSDAILSTSWTSVGDPILLHGHQADLSAPIDRTLPHAFYRIRLLAD